MKKKNFVFVIVTLLLSFTLIFTLAGCGSNAHAGINDPNRKKFKVPEGYLNRVNFPRVDDYIDGENFDIQGYFKACGITYGHTDSYYEFMDDYYFYKVYNSNSPDYGIIRANAIKSTDELEFHTRKSDNTKYNIGNDTYITGDTVVELQDLCYVIKYDKNFMMGHYEFF